MEEGTRLLDIKDATLDLEETRWIHGRTRSEAIATLGTTITRCYLVLNHVLASPHMRTERPELVGRLLHLQDRHAGE